MQNNNRKRQPVSKVQQQYLIQYMENHILFAKKQTTKLGREGVKTYRRMWSALTEELNRLGPSKKNTTQWERLWTEMRLNAKKKAVYLKAYRATGNKHIPITLSDNDIRISSLFGKYGTGLNIVRELGFSNSRPVINHEDNSLNQFEDDSFTGLGEIFNFNLNSEQNKKLITNYSDCPRQHQIHDASNYGKFPREQRRALKPSNKQLNVLLEYMEEHPKFAKGEEKDDEKWDVLTTLLNTTEGVVKSQNMWKRTWNDQVALARQNVSLMAEGLKTEPINPRHMRTINLVKLLPKKLEHVELQLPAAHERLRQLQNCTEKKNCESKTTKYREAVLQNAEEDFAESLSFVGVCNASKPPTSGYDLPKPTTSGYNSPKQSTSKFLPTEGSSFVSNSFKAPTLAQNVHSTNFIRRTPYECIPLNRGTITKNTLSERKATAAKQDRSQQFIEKFKKVAADCFEDALQKNKENFNEHVVNIQTSINNSFSEIIEVIPDIIQTHVHNTIELIIPKICNEVAMSVKQLFANEDLQSMQTETFEVEPFDELLDVDPNVINANDDDDFDECVKEITE